MWDNTLHEVEEGGLVSGVGVEVKSAMRPL